MKIGRDARNDTSERRLAVARKEVHSGSGYECHTSKFSQFFKAATLPIRLEEIARG